MKASNIFKIFVRTFMGIFLVAFILTQAYSSPNKENYRDKIEKLQIENNSKGALAWLSLDQNQSKAHLKTGMQKLNNSEPEEFKNEIKIAKRLIAEENQSPLYLEIEKAEKAYENVIQLKKNLELIPKNNFKFVRLISKSNPMVVGHVLEAKDDFVSIRDQDGFVIMIHRNNIIKMDEIEGSEKTKIFSDQLSKVMEDNGKTSSYGLYLSAKWAYENELPDKVNSILISAAMNDSQILFTITENEAKKLLTVAKWSNLIGDYDIAKDKAQLVLTSFSGASKETIKDTEETLQDILKNIEKESKINASFVNNPPVETVVSQIEREDFVKAPVLDPVAEKQPEVIKDVVPPKNTLKIKDKSQGEVVKEALVKPAEKKDDGLEEKPGKMDGKNPPIKAALFQEKVYQSAVELVGEGKTLMKKANSFDNPGNKNAQANFKLALGKFEDAVNQLNKISKKYAGNDDFEELAQQASGMRFFITKSCLRLK